MDRVHRNILLSLVMTASLVVPAAAQVSLAGVWDTKLHEDFPERLPGPELGDYLGVPLNANARARAMAWDASILTLPEYQCRVHPIDYVPSFANMRIWEDVDPASQQLTAIHFHHFAWATERTVWMDGRPHPPEYAPHASMGFSTGEWIGDTLKISTTHLKEGWIRRNGIPRSDKATLTEYFIRHGDGLTWVTIIYDPAYLTETYIRSRDYTVNPVAQIPAYPCESVTEVVRAKGTFPHHLPGTNTFLKEYQDAHRIPEEAAMGGAMTMYPEYMKKIVRPPAAAAKK
jgi:hypothetical protein